MPFTFGSAGGADITSPLGVLVLCSTGDGRQAINQDSGLNLCDFCTKNLAFLSANGTFGQGTTQQYVLTILTNNNKTNLRGN